MSASGPRGKGSEKVELSNGHTHWLRNRCRYPILNGIFWLVGNSRLHELNVFSAGFVLGMLGMYIAAWLYGYHR
jgi:hypothetical protein